MGVEGEVSARGEAVSSKINHVTPIQLATWTSFGIQLVFDSFVLVKVVSPHAAQLSIHQECCSSMKDLFKVALLREKKEKKD